MTSSFTYDDTPVVCSEEEARTAQRLGTRAYAQASPHHQHKPWATFPPAVAEMDEKRTWGLRRTTLYLLIAAGLLFVGMISAAAAAGVLAGQKHKAEAKLNGLSLGQNSSVGGELDTDSISDGNPGGALATTTLPAPSLATFSVQRQFGDVRPSCPSSGGTIFTVPGTNLRYRRECNVDYVGADLGRVPMSTMEDCIRLCAMYYKFPQSAEGRCLMVNWIHADPQGTEGSFCFLKFEKRDGGAKQNVETAYLVDAQGNYVGDEAKFAAAIG